MSTRIRSITFAAVVMIMASAFGVDRAVAQSVARDELCWRSLSPDSGKQDVALFMIRPSLAAVGSSEAWLSWQEDEARILRWVKRRWTPAPLPARAGVEGLWEPVVAASPSGRVVVAAYANYDDGRSALHIARATGGSWQWLGEPLISSREPFTHAHEVSIAFVDRERPVVAWSEERNANLAGLFVAQWNGSSWTRLGALAPQRDDSSYISPVLAVDANQQIWLAWDEARRGVRVARWDGAAWREVGGEGLEKIVAAQGRTALRELSLGIDSRGRAWLVRLAARDTSGARLALARWDGSNWAAVAAPRGPEGKDATVWSAAMILRADAPIVAWSQADASDNHYLFVSEWAPGDRWTARLSGVHLVEGVSNVSSVRLAPGDAHSFFVSWDEPGKDERRTRVVQAYTCAAGETPAAPPKSAVERDTWPTTVDEAVRRIIGTLDNESKARVRATSKDQLIQYHLGWGMGIRNSLGLWRGNDKLLESCGRGKPVHPDECSMVIIEAVWTLLQTP